jgi:hypothetical protein
LLEIKSASARIAIFFQVFLSAGDRILDKTRFAGLLSLKFELVILFLLFVKFKKI